MKEIILSLFNFFRKKENLETERIIDPISPVYNELVVKGPTLHEDLNGLIWIADGKYKNYSNKDIDGNTFNIGTVTISIRISGQEEPSLIYTAQKVTKPSNISNIERPPYFPNYSNLSPEQKWIYLNLLINPYSVSIDIGYVFILYYGLERHLLNGEYEKAFKTILKLRDVHTNSSFQYYSANALILSAMLHKRIDLGLAFLDSLDKEHEFNFSDNLYLICCYSFDKPIKSNDIIRMARTFEFTNMNYIKNYPEIFNETLRSILLKRYGTDGLLLKNLLPETEISKIRSTKERMFANMSMIGEEISVPQFVKCNKIKKVLFELLSESHEAVKGYLAQKRKEGNTIKSNKKSLPKKELVFDFAQEKNLLKELEINANDKVKRHFTFIYLQDFYYKYRTLDTKYIEACKKYCLADINDLEEMYKEYIDQEIKRVMELKDIYGENETKKQIREIEKEGFIGSIPAFKRLSIILEKEGKIKDAILICDYAIKFNQQVEYFNERKNKLQNKLE